MNAVPRTPTPYNTRYLIVKDKELKEVVVLVSPFTIPSTLAFE